MTNAFGKTGAQPQSAAEPSPANEVDVAGLPITLLSRVALFNRVERAVTNSERISIFHVNARLIRLANSSVPEILGVLRDPGAESICDSSFPRFLARVTGQQVPERLAFNRWLLEFFCLMEANGRSIYLLGASEKTLDAVREKAALATPRLRVAGIQHGYVDLADDQVSRSIIESINASGTDVLLVALGMPFQEQWISRYRADLTCSVVMPCGGALDFMSGLKPVAPHWMSAAGLEWLFRIVAEPRRLLIRNLQDTLGTIAVCAQRMTQKRTKGREQ